MPSAAPLAAATAFPPVTVITRQQGKSTASVGSTAAAVATVTNRAASATTVKS